MRIGLPKDVEPGAGRRFVDPALILGRDMATQADAALTASAWTTEQPVSPGSASREAGAGFRRGGARIRIGPGVGRKTGGGAVA